MNEDEEIQDPVEEVQTEDPPEVPAIDPGMAAAMREIMREEMKALMLEKAENTPETSQFTGAENLTRFEAVDLMLDDILESNDGEYEDMPKEIKRAIRDELREVCMKEDVDPMQVKAAGYHKKVANEKVVAAMRAKTYVPSAWKLASDEPTRTSAPVQPLRPKATAKQREEAADLSAVFGQEFSNKLLNKVIGAG